MESKFFFFSWLTWNFPKEMTLEGPKIRAILKEEPLARPLSPVGGQISLSRCCFFFNMYFITCTPNPHSKSKVVNFLFWTKSFCDPKMFGLTFCNGRRLEGDTYAFAVTQLSWGRGSYEVNPPFAPAMIQRTREHMQLGLQRVFSTEQYGTFFLKRGW